MKLKSLKKIKKDGEGHTILKKKPSYVEYLLLNPTGDQSTEGLLKFFKTYAPDLHIESYPLDLVTLILEQSVATLIIKGTSSVLACATMSGDVMQKSVKGWVVSAFVYAGIAISGGGFYDDVNDNEPKFAVKNKEQEIEDMVKEAVTKESVPSSPSLSGKHDFYDVVAGTSSGSLYVVVGLGVKQHSNIAIRYNGSTLSLRCDPAPSAGGILDLLTLVGFKPSGGTHVSCHLGMSEGDPMTRYFMLLKAALIDYYTFCKIDLSIVKTKGV